jgi:putative peptide zinc metalloprotease protein
MVSPLLQSAWEQAHTQKPRSHPELEAHQRAYRGERWYVLKMSGRERLHRINAQAWFVLRHCDGEHTLSKILALYRQQHPGSDFDEVALLKLVNQFMHEGLLQRQSLPPNSPTVDKPRWQAYLANPFVIRLPLLDPHRWVAPLADRLWLLFHPVVLLLLLLALLWGVLQAAVHWQSITHGGLDRVLRPDNLLWLWLLYPLTKSLHELGHAIATYRYGGEVHETGVTFMYGVPLPYVDASAATLFPRRWQRMAVDAAGIWVELLLALLALIVWLNSSDGLVRQLAYNVMIICSVSTLFFNANPLMRFDGYYLLADYLEMPNLASRASLYWRYLFKRYLLRLDEHFAADTRERYWLAGYGLGATLYRWVIVFWIIYLAASWSLLLGAVVGVWLITQQVLKPLWQFVSYLLSDALAARRAPALRNTGLLLTALLLVLFVMPLPQSVVASGVVWLPEQARVRAEAEGRSVVLHQAQGVHVTEGEPLFRLDNAWLFAEYTVANAERDELAARLAVARIEDPIEAEQLEESLASSEAVRARLEQQLANLTIKSPASGRFYLPPGQQARGRFVSSGDVMGYVIRSSETVVRVLVNQNDFSLISRDAPQISVRFADRGGQVRGGRLVRTFPTATHALPSPALSSLYGGPIAVDPADETGLTAVDEWFELEVAVAGDGSLGWPGARVLVKFDAALEPLAWQYYRKLRQLFIRQLSQ